ncbi:MAG: hypothetical protein ABI743_10945 [bacterium]
MLNPGRCYTYFATHSYDSGTDIGVPTGEGVWWVNAVNPPLPFHTLEDAQALVDKLQEAGVHAGQPVARDRVYGHIPEEVAGQLEIWLASVAPADAARMLRYLADEVERQPPAATSNHTPAHATHS